MAIPSKKKNPEGRQQRPLWPEQDYEAIVLNAIEGESKSSGRDMTTLELELYNSKGETIELKSYIVHEDEDGNQTSWCEAMIDALVVEEDGENGVEASALIGRQCIASLIHETDEYKGKKRTKERIDILKRHPQGPIAGETAAAPSGASSQELPPPNDDLPF